MEKKLVNFRRFVYIFAILCLVTTACGPTGKVFIKEGPIEPGYEAVAEIDVHKKGFWFLWMIPFKIGSEGAAQKLMEEEIKNAYPDAAGVYEYRVVEDYLPWFWVSGARIVGKIVVQDGSQ